MATAGATTWHSGRLVFLWSQEDLFGSEDQAVHEQDFGKGPAGAERLETPLQPAER